MKKFIRYLIVLCLLVATANTCSATEPTIIRKFDTKIRFQPYPTVNGPVHFKIEITPNYDCDFVEVKSIVLDNLTSQDLVEQQLKVKKGEITSFEFSLVLPDAAISGCEFAFRGCNSNSRGVSRYYFAPMDDTVFVYYNKPEKSFEQIVDEYKNPTNVRIHPEILRRQQEEKERREKYPQGYMESYILDADGNEIRLTDEMRDSISVVNKKRMADWAGKPLGPGPQRYQVYFEDGTESLMTRNEMGAMYRQIKSDYEVKKIDDSSYSFIKRIDPQLKRMRELEQKPLIDSDRESITVDGIIYERHKGEYKFKEKGEAYKVDRKTKYNPKVDSLHKAIEGMEPYYVLDLREPSDLEFAKKYLDSLVATEKKGFYVSKVPLEVRKLFRANRVKGLMLRNSDRENRIKKLIEDLINESSEDKEDPAEYSTQASSTLFFEGFEGSFPGANWITGDENLAG